MTECPGSLSKGDLGPVHHHCLAHFQNFRLIVGKEPVPGPLLVELDQEVRVRDGYCIIQSLGYLIYLLIKC